MGLVYSVVIPGHNEGKNIEPLISRLIKVLKTLDKPFEIVFINDNSNDNSLEVLSRLKNVYKELFFFNRIDNPGVGNAKRLGFNNIKGKYVITLDGDLSHDPQEIYKFIPYLKDYDMVCGSRYIDSGKADMGFSRKIISFSFNFFFRKIIGLPINDFTSGFRVFKSEIIKKIELRSRGFGIYVEIPIKAFLSGYNLIEVPITYSKRLEGKSNLSYLKQGPEYLKVIFQSIKMKYFR